MNGLTGNTPVRRLSRETRHLLFAACIALLTLWVLARIRFPERPSTPNPIPPLLTQLSARPGFTELEAEIATLQSRLGPSLLRVPDGGGPDRGEARPALRIASDMALALLDPAVSPATAGLHAIDRGTGLALIRTTRDDRVALPVPWAADGFGSPRYLLAASPTAQSVWLRPVFIGGLTPQAHPGWTGPVWSVATTADLPFGTLLFTPGGDFAGGVAADRGGTFIVPGHVLLSDAQQLQRLGGTEHATLGIEVQSLTASLRLATGGNSGVVVAWVEPGAAPAGDLAIGDVIESVNGRAVASARDWQVYTGRLTPGERIALAVRRGDASREVLVRASSESPEDAATLGLVLRSLPRVGAEVVRVEPGTAAARAGLRPGDVVTSAGSIRAPGPAQIAQAYASATATRPLLLGFMRGDVRRVAALVK
jgi:hypothetical protein